MTTSSGPSLNMAVKGDRSFTMPRRVSGIGQDCLSSKISLWQKRADDHEANQLINPFSYWEGASHRAVLSKDDPNYGRPVEGSLTERRGKKADKDICAGMAELCHVIKSLGKAHSDGTYTITFGQLFLAYTRISEILVGLLIRARRHGLVKFDGEMLYQRQDEHVIITCLQVPE